MNIVYPTKTLRIPSGATQSLYGDQTLNGSQYRFSVVGPGTADIQPIFDGQATHKAETVQNDSIVLDLSGVDNVDISASGGNISVIATVFHAS